MNPISGATGATPSGTSNSPAPSLGNDQLGEQAFLQLLVAELKNQDPTQPMDGKALISQLAQLNQTQSSQQMVTLQQESFASSLIGKTVTGSLNGAPLVGQVTSFAIKGSSVMLNVNGQPMNVTSVQQVANTTPTTTTSTTTPTDGGQA